MDNCKECNDPLEDDGKVRKKKRARKCRGCRDSGRVKARREDPVKLIQHRWQTSSSKRWPLINRELVSIDTVRSVWERCEHKSVIDGSTDAKHLCITAYGIVPPDLPTKPEQLMIVTTTQAQSIGKVRNAEVQKTLFPPQPQPPSVHSSNGSL